LQAERGPLGAIFGRRDTYTPANLAELRARDLSLILVEDFGEVRWRGHLPSGRSPRRAAMLARIAELLHGRYRLPVPAREQRQPLQNVPLGVILGRRETYRRHTLQELSKADLSLILVEDFGEARYTPNPATGLVSQTRERMIVRILDLAGVVEAPMPEQLTLC
jgi:hypothetical protein